MTRRLLNLLAILSLFTFVATAALWIRSHFVHDTARYTARWRLDEAGKGHVFTQRVVGHRDGRVELMTFREWSAVSAWVGRPPYEMVSGWNFSSFGAVAAPPPRSPWNRLGIWYGREE